MTRLEISRSRPAGLPKPWAGRFQTLFVVFVGRSAVLIACCQYVKVKSDGAAKSGREIIDLLAKHARKKYSNCQPDVEALASREINAD
ncbi:hypothetical protein EVAR_98940_1 [Eumeta japonica]|uniref:Uncharacterized protein n=1 Tax=Eumeta variegata TaxID=151549 RepID=A0A4C1TEM3_EUMVA|nr:hypothetical protein EVAR_98940_1 [Eumeta japonica]